ncbi:25S rRNA (adenine(645)-N(1))-methyltransferase [Sphaceloma murrayae]|uniref:Ribosomal RNA-processing protein 8 n=1 Tax=Sphaceloma murrayae TaxID=2082308 RepID=A0A2K1QM67_9PEZI|nr:25S rRNA (adenine(645)-N(1))-methyltransferase [Sphaceloma murrayae]
MFAVPGWSVSASAPKRQTEADIRRNDASGAAAEGKGRKRKRKSGAGASTTEPNVEKQWKKTFENGSLKSDQDGQRSSKKAKKSKDRKSKSTDKKSTPNANNTPLGTPRVRESPPSSSSTVEEKTEPVSKPTDMPSETKVSNSSKHPSVSPAPPPASHKPAPPLPPPALTPLQQKMRSKLISARFRHLNQTLYTTPSTSSLSLFSDSPSIFEDYHAGFRQQVSVWPSNPLEVFISAIETRAKVKERRGFRKGKGQGPGEVSEANGGPEEVEALPRTGGKCVIADLGCGDAEMARRLVKGGTARKKGLEVLSFDLAAPNEYITKADVADLPLGEGKVDVAVFCLALMGTNWIEFVEEAWRVLRWKGELWVAEIKSRFGRRGEKVVEHSVGKRRKTQKKAVREEERDEEEELKTAVDGVERREETDVGAFVEVLARRGFVLKKGQQSIDLSNKMFVRMEFVKAAAPVVGKNVKPDTRGGTEKAAGGKKRFIETDEVDVESEAKVLKPCLYKIR